MNNGIVGVGRKKLNDDEERIAVAKVDTSGTVLWEKLYGGSGVQIGTNVVELPDHSLIVSGRKESDDAMNTLAYLLKLNSAGDSIGQRTLNNEGKDVARVCRNTSDGNLAVLCESGAFGDEGDTWLLKIAANLEDACGAGGFI